MISQDPMISMSATHEVPLKGSIIRGFYHVGALVIRIGLWGSSLL